MTEIQTLLNRLPSIEELKKRAVAVAKIQPTLGGMQESTEYAHEETHKDITGLVTHWDDGGGQSLTFVFTKDKTLLLAYDHETSTNFYDDDYVSQLRLYEGVPEELLLFVKNVDENYWNLNIAGPDSKTISSASAVAWFDTAGWHYAAAFDELRGDEDGGLNYCLSPLLVTKESVTVDDFIDELVDTGWDTEPEILATAREILVAELH